MKKENKRYYIITILTVVLFTTCRGYPSKKPAIHPNMNMDQQARKEAQTKNTFFADNRTMRTPVEGTIPRGYLNNNIQYDEGKTLFGDYINTIPIIVDKPLLNRGKSKYDIYCTPCHGVLGDGKGIITISNYGYTPAPSYHIERLRNMPDGELFSAIRNGVRTMPSYAIQVSKEDSWAIVAYIRALQKSQNLTIQEARSVGMKISAPDTSIQNQSFKN